MKIQNVIIRCEEGLHLRVASKVAKIAQRAGGDVHICCEGCPRVNACSVLDLLTLGAAAGTPLEIVAECPDEDQVVRELSDVFEAGGGI
jgi:phosphotransferase system HPr (HPr) family protein